MTWTLAPDDPKRDTLQRIHSRRSPRASKGQVVYGPEFWNYAHPTAAHTPGAAPNTKPRDTAREPVSPIESLSRWYWQHEWFASVIFGLFLAGMAGTIAYWIVG